MPGTEEEGEKETGMSTLGCLWFHILPAPQGAHYLGVRMHLNKKIGGLDPISVLANLLINTQRRSGILRPLRNGPQ